MSYGVEITNQNNVRILGSGEEAFLYWGKFSARAGQTVRVFNIPVTVDITVYSTLVENSKSTAELLPGTGGDTGYWVIKMSRGPFDATPLTDHYVFVESKYIPSPAYGIEVRGEDSNVQFHTGRVPLQYRSLVSIPEFDGKSDGVRIEVGYRCAISSRGSGYTVTGYISGGILRSIIRIFGLFCYGTQLAHEQVAQTNQPFLPEYGFLFARYDVPLIEVDYYDRFASLLTWDEQQVIWNENPS